MWSTSLHVLSHMLLKLGTALLTEPATNMSHIFASATFSSKTVFGFGLSFQKTSCITPQTWYLQGIQIWKATVGHYSFLIICRQFASRCHAQKYPPWNYIPPCNDTIRPDNFWTSKSHPARNKSSPPSRSEVSAVQKYPPLRLTKRSVSL